MAVNRADRYPGRWGAADADYPLGTPKNRTSPTSNDGSYFEKDWIADYEAFFGALLSDAGETPNGTVDTAQSSQLFNAMLKRRPVENRIKGQQSWNIPDPSGDPLVSSTPTLYTVGEFPAVNVEVVNANAVNLRRVGELVIGDSGTLRIYARGAYRAGVIDETTEYMGIKDHTGAQLEAGVATGVTKGNNGVDLYVDVDLAQFSANGFKFAGISAERGLWGEVGDDDQATYDLAIRSRRYQDVTSSRALGVTYTNATLAEIVVLVRISATGNSITSFFSIDGVTVQSGSVQSVISGPTHSYAIEVPPGSTYSFNLSQAGSLISAYELRI